MSTLSLVRGQRRFYSALKSIVVGHQFAENCLKLNVRNDITKISRTFSSRTDQVSEVFDEFSNEKLEKNSTEKLDAKLNLDDSEAGISKLMSFLKDQRIKDTCVFKLDNEPNTVYNHMVICTTLSSRQASSIANALRLLTKSLGDKPLGQSKMITKLGNGWFVTEVDSIQVHVMNEECRRKYDLETMWSGDESKRIEAFMEHQEFLPPPNTQRK
ncbi:unnamed protein product [Caenorhabditis auriculariae]|uniref:Ribosomal silencing factor RsfS n=1 Tax=Caenorhabditis auriculariae TaxID=2777116 RepID=A0A8S1GVW4_9PELO|nr:unnamed protein product [Caenorhabditis auriculariae]